MEENKQPPRMYTVQEVAHFLHVHVSTVRRWTKRGLLKVHQFGPRGGLRFKREDIFDVVEKSKKTLPNGGYCIAIPTRANCGKSLDAKPPKATSSTNEPLSKGAYNLRERILSRQSEKKGGDKG